MLRALSVCFYAVLLSFARLAEPQSPLGSEFKVTVKAELTQDSQRLAVADDGSFAVVWRDARGSFSPYMPFAAARFFDSQGNPLGGDQELPGENGGDPFIVNRSDGGFQALWFGRIGDDAHLFVQRFLPLGEEEGDAVIYPLPDPGGMLITNAVATVKDRIILSWITGQPFYQVKAIKINPRAATLGKPVSLAMDLENALFIGDVGVDRQGRSVVVWDGECGVYGQSHCDVFAQRLSASSAKLGLPVRVNTKTGGLQENAMVAVAGDGSFLVIWESAPGFPGPSPVDVFAQRFSAAGEKLGKEFRVNPLSNSIQFGTEAVADSAGNYLVAWRKLEPENGLYGFNLYGQLYRHDGRRVGKAFRINTRNTYNSFPDARVAFGGNGTFVAVWNANDNDFDGVYGQRFAASPADEPCLVRGGDLLCDTGRTGGEAELQLSLPGGQIVFGDVDGDGRKDPCVFEAGHFQCDMDHRGQPYEAALTFGLTGDVALFGDVDGDGRDEPCVRRGRFHLCDTGHDGGRAEVSFGIGDPADQSLLGDLDGDGRDDACVFDSGGRFLCDTRHNGGADLTIAFGQPGDLAALGDFDGDGDDDPCVFRAGKLLCDTAHNGGAAEADLVFGQLGDRPLLSNLDGL